jgi:hypothetical protein
MRDLNVVVTPRSERSITTGGERRGMWRRAVSVQMEFLSKTGKVESMNLQNNGLPGSESRRWTTACR